MKQDWKLTVAHTRREAMRTLREIRAGTVSEEDLNKLNNFVQFALALMQEEGPKKWALAKVHAELFSFTLEGE